MTIPVMFQTRERCVSCASPQSIELSSGRFGEQPARGYIESDPWGEDPMPHLENEKWALQQCADCGQKQHRYILSSEWNEIRFTRWMSQDAIRQFEAEHATGQSSAADHVQHVLRLKSLGVRRILDFGCGFGQFLEMCRLFGMEAIGVDRSHARRSGANAAIFAELDEVSGSFDAITMFEVLEHLDDPLATLKMLVGRLKPGGIMIVEVPDTTGVTDMASREHYYKIHPLDHINAFTPKSLVALMGKAGLAPIRKGSAFVTTSLKRLAKDIGKAMFKQETTQRYFRLL